MARNSLTYRAAWRNGCKAARKLMDKPAPSFRVVWQIMVQKRKEKKNEKSTRSRSLRRADFARFRRGLSDAAIRPSGPVTDQPTEENSNAPRHD